MDDQYDEMPIADPPEIREPKEKFRLIEFIINLGEPRPDLALLQLVFQYLEMKPPMSIMSLNFTYHLATDRGDPNLMVGHLMVGEPVDIG